MSQSSQSSASPDLKKCQSQLSSCSLTTHPPTDLKELGSPLIMPKLQQKIQILQSKPISTLSKFDQALQRNRQWSARNLLQDPLFFVKHLESQKPKYLWISCSDSRIPAETISGLRPGDAFVHRNIANQVPISDINALSVVQYAVQVLQVKDIIIMGHYGCGGIKAAFRKYDHGPLESWLSHIRDIRIKFRKQMVRSDQENEDLLCELNVKQQVYDVCKIPIVQKAWSQGQELRVHGCVYQLGNGILNDLGLTLSKIQEIPKEFWIYQALPARSNAKKPSFGVNLNFDDQEDSY